MRCQIKYLSGNDNKNWTDTRDLPNDIPLWKDPHLCLNYENFWSNTALFPPYQVPAASDETIRNLELCVASCTPRIQRERTAIRATEIIESLQSVIDTMKEPQQHRYKLNKELYRNPPKMSATDLLQVPQEEIRRLKEICVDKARKRLEGELGIIIERVKSLVEWTHYVVVQTPNNVKDPFYIAQASTPCNCNNGLKF